MNRYYSYLNSAKEIITSYNGEEPLSAYLKKFFSGNKKYGSKDRKQITHLCYCYFRLGKMADTAIEERIILGLFLCSDSSNEILQLVKPEWNEIVIFPLADKLTAINNDYSIKNVFPWDEDLSNGIEQEAFCKSFFIQPDLFIRLRPGNENAVVERLNNAGILFSQINATCLSMFNRTKIDSVIDLDKEAVIQDLNSQRVAELMRSAFADLPVFPEVWDCCAASGGKSLLAYDLRPTIKLTVSDIREGILVNLRKRFAKAGINGYKNFITDLSKQKINIPGKRYDFIIADVPCSGSGTWSRTPEQLYFFNSAEIANYSSLQKKIIMNVVDYLKPGGYLLYITCSVFNKENEEAVEVLTQQTKLTIKEVKLFTGYSQKADTLFAALLHKPL